MDSDERPRAPVPSAPALGSPVLVSTVLGLLAVAELAARLTSGVTTRAGAAGPVVHTGASVLTVLLMAAFCLLATVPAGLRRPVPAALAVWVAALLSLLLFELVTLAGAAALVMAAYRLARAGSRVLAVALAAPFLGLALALAAAVSRPVLPPGNVSGLAVAGLETRVLAVLLASAIPVAVVAAIARGAREVDRSHSATRELAEGMLADHLARGERARIARELHDVVAHHISVIAVQAETARLTTPGLPDAGAERFAAIGDTARAGLTEMRRLLGVLREDAQASADQDPPTTEADAPALAASAPGLAASGVAAPGPATLSPATLSPATSSAVADRHPQPDLAQLGDLIDEAREACGSVVRLIVSGPVTRLDPGVELAAYRIVQEALTNARRHAPGAAVDVELRYDGDVLRLRIRDNGPGPAARRTGHGLLGMRERAAAAGGSLRTGDAPGGGFRIDAQLPAKALDTMTSAPVGAPR
jgi:signal transduction histidine kinase